MGPVQNDIPCNRHSSSRLRQATAYLHLKASMAPSTMMDEERVPAQMQERRVGNDAASSQDDTSWPPGDGRHKTRLAIAGAGLFTTSCILPLLLYFVLKYKAHTAESITLAVPSAVFGVFSLLSYGQRSWSLGRRASISRPIGGGRWAFDFFHWNFTVGFLYVTALIAASTASKPALPRLATLPLTLLIAQVCSQLVLVQLLAAVKSTYFMRVSSMPRGQSPIRPALYTIIEDVIAVDGEQGTAWRVAFNKRYESSTALPNLLKQLSWLWGVTGLAIVAVDMVLIFILHDVDISWVIGKCLGDVLATRADFCSRLVGTMGMDLHHVVCDVFHDPFGLQQLTRSRCAVVFKRRTMYSELLASWTTGVWVEGVVLTPVAWSMELLLLVTLLGYRKAVLWLFVLAGSKHSKHIGLK